MKSLLTLHAVRKMDIRFCLPLLLMVSLSSSECDLTPSPGQMTGRVTGMTCLEYAYANVTFFQCALQCYLQAQCRVAYQKCESYSCFCVFCSGVEEIDFGVVDEKFFLKGRVLAKNVAIPPGQNVSMPGGLFVGQVIVAKVALTSGWTILFFELPNSDILFTMSIRMQTRSVVRNSYINGRWGSEERSKPHFNFAPGQEVEVVYIIRQSEYNVYIDKVPFFTFKHRVHDNLAAVQFYHIGGGGTETGGNCKSLFVII